MTKRVSAALAKAQFSALSAEVAFGGQPVVIERRGKPLVALVSMADLERLEQDRTTSGEPQGALALVGAWREIPDEEIDAFIQEIYASREQEAARTVELEP